MIDWLSSENHVFLNPRMPPRSREELLKDIPILHSLKGHLFVATSGSGGVLKWVALSKSACLISAEAVNRHLDSGPHDIWLNPLPDFHVGGLSISARGFLSQAAVMPGYFPDSKWNPHFFLKLLEEFKVTLTSLVPTQVYDLVRLGLKAPSSLRAVVVGGGALNQITYTEALKLGWKVLPSYGLTECASQVATAPYGDWNLSSYPLLKPLSHVELSLDEEGYLKIKSQSLLTGYIIQNSLFDPKIHSFFKTEDVATFEKEWIQSISRAGNFVKIGGENVDLARLENILDEEKIKLHIEQDCALIDIEEERLGCRLHLAIAPGKCERIDQLIAAYHQRVFPFERIHCLHVMAEIPRSPLKKLLKVELKNRLNKLIS